jgi:hypothetical protein
VDVLHGHLADQSFRPADGTTYSIDFLASRGEGSRGMSPYSGFAQLRRHVVASLQSGAEGPTANGERHHLRGMTDAVQLSLRGQSVNKWGTVEAPDMYKSTKAWGNDVDQMGDSEGSSDRSNPGVTDLSSTAFKKSFGSTNRGVGRIRIVEN